jgi:DNA-binding MarR family transcriptional regulator
MHKVFFGLKRAHHGVLRVTRGALAKMGLTPARFDLLYAVREREGLRQIELCTALGVSRPTVCRMLRSLEDLGLIERDTSCADLRQRFVFLTYAGRRCIRKAVRRFIRWGMAQLMLHGALCPDEWWDTAACSRAEKALEKALDAIRLAFRDVANLYDPWCDGDDGPVIGWRLPDPP